MQASAPYLFFDEYQNRLEKLKELQSLGIDPYPHQFSPNDSLNKVEEKYKSAELQSFDEAAASTAPGIKLAGRLVLMRAMGKNMFAHIQDDTAKFQIMFSRDLTILAGYKPGAEDPAASKIIEKKFDLGDIIGVEGQLFRTQKGELTLLVKNATLLTKSLLPLPDKHAGLSDKQLRYRKRWLDLISHQDVMESFKKRSLILREIRNYFHEHEFIEVETPILQNNYGGAQARPFTSHLNALDVDMFLRISLEISLKKLLIGGIPRVFEIGKIFRNEGIDRTHNPEFTMVEAYSAFWDYHDMMRFVENLFERLALKLYGSTKVLYDEKEIDFKAPWKRLTMIEAIETLAGVRVEGCSDQELRNQLVAKTQLSQEEVDPVSRGLLIQMLFEELVEKHLIDPVHIIDHPIETTPLCKPHRDPKFRSSGLVERFESFVMGKEICNAYSELNDPVLQRKLFEEQARAKESGNEEAHPMDEEFLEAICQGMPPAGGIGIGIDRLVMVLSNAHSIRDVIFFPLMKPEQQETV